MAAQPTPPTLHTPLPETIDIDELRLVILELRASKASWYADTVRYQYRGSQGLADAEDLGEAAAELRKADKDVIAWKKYLEEKKSITQ